MDYSYLKYEGNQFIIYSNMPREANISNLYIDMLGWKDYGGSKAIGTAKSGNLDKHIFAFGITLNGVTT
ncbi:hypothetical protein [Paenibacillus sp. NPDC057967]|uniref:hypothetical protein n=1 Tax=Paenibacillus sp. NPDC057967 TaxID=3346293 RepID=UPI0036DAF30E